MKQKKIEIKILVVAIILSSLVMFIPKVHPTENSVNQTKIDSMFIFLEDVVGLDTTKYTTELVSTSPTISDNRGEGTHIHYRFNSEESNLTVTFDFRDNTIVYCRITKVSGSPIMTKSETNCIDYTKDFFSKYQQFSSASYLEAMNLMLNEVTDTKNVTIEQDNIKMTLTNMDGGYGKLQWTKITRNVTNNQSKISLQFHNGTFRYFVDAWNNYAIGSTEVQVSEEEAIGLALERIETFSYTFGNTTITDFVVLSDASIYPKLTMEPRNGKLYPLYELYIPLDRIYPANVYSIHPFMWADTGEISVIRARLKQPRRNTNRTYSRVSLTYPFAHIFRNLSSCDSCQKEHLQTDLRRKFKT